MLDNKMLGKDQPLIMEGLQLDLKYDAGQFEYSQNQPR